MADTRRDNHPSLLLPALAYAGTLFVCVWLLKHPLADAPLPLRSLVALMPMVPVVWMIRVTVMTILARDEMQRRIDLEAIAIASLGVGLGSLSLALLTISGAWDISGRTALTWVFPALCLCYALARHWVARRYQ